MIKRVIHFRSRYLGLSETFVHAYVSHLQRWRPLVVTGELVNEDVFPTREAVVVPGVVWPASRVARTAWWIERLFRYRHADVDGALHAKLTRALIRTIRGSGATLFHAHFAGDALRVLPATQRTGLPLVTTFYGYDIATAAANEADRKPLQPLLTHGTAFLVEGPHMMTLARRAGCPAERLALQRIAVDLELLPFKPPRPPRNRPVRVLLASRFIEKKGVPYGVRAFARACAENANLELWLVGDGPLRAEVDRALEECGLNDGRVRRHAFLKYDAYRRLIRAADIYLAPSLTAANGDAEGGAPTALLEMQAIGKPIVATRHADIPYVVREGESALLADERDVDGLAAALLRLAAAPDRWLSMARAGRAHVEARHDIRKEAPRLERIYDAIVHGQPLPAHQS